MDQTRYSDDVQLWQRLLNGDQGAVSGLFRKYYRPLLNYGLKLVPDPELVKDSLQELFFDMWNQRANLSQVEHVRSYLYTSLRRAVFRQAEIKQVRHKRDKTYAEEYAELWAFREGCWEEEEGRAQQKQRLKQALEQLKDREREAIFLKFYSGLSNAEIAQVMGVNQQSVYNYIYRAIQSLQAILSG